jgi:cephalosporin hydroxylase
MILNSVRPDVILTTTRDDGLIQFLESILGAIGLESLRIIRILPSADAHVASPHVDAIYGAPYAPATLSAITRAIGSAEQVVVLFEPQSDDFRPVEEIKTYARFVSFHSYFVFLGTVLGQPWLGYSRYWFAAAIRQFLQQEPTFVRDPTKDEQIALMCAQGYLKRVRKRDLFEAYDTSLDEFP